LVLRLSHTAVRAFLLLAVRPGRRLVEQEAPRLHRERPAARDDLLYAEREIGDQLLAAPLELEELDDLLHAAPMGRLLAARAPPEEAAGEHARAHVAVAAERGVVGPGHPA